MFGLPSDSSNKTLKKKTFYFEAFGSGGFYSFGYDKIYRVTEKKKRSFSIGASYLNISSRDRETKSGYNIYSIPVSFNTIRFKYLETGLGITPLVLSYSDRGHGHGGTSWWNQFQSYMLFISPKIGFRYQKPNGGIFFRLAYTPMISVFYNTDWTDRFNHSFGLSLGYTF